MTWRLDSRRSHETATFCRRPWIRHAGGGSRALGARAYLRLERTRGETTVSVLIADDDRLLNLILASLFRNKGWTVSSGRRDAGDDAGDARPSRRDRARHQHAGWHRHGSAQEAQGFREDGSHSRPVVESGSI